MLEYNAPIDFIAFSVLTSDPSGKKHMGLNYQVEWGGRIVQPP